ncbi:unnamed protein product, partial [Mesorhabditis spiculigera]
MVTVHSGAEQAELRKQILKRGKCGVNLVHIGMANRKTGNSYKSIWRDGSVVNYSNWFTGAPSYVVFTGAATYVENCTVVIPEGRWNDVSCIVNLVSTAACVCMKRYDQIGSERWVSSTTNFYILSEASVLGSDCLSNCSKYNLELPAIHSKVEQAALLQKFSLLRSSAVHLGMTNIQNGTKYISAWRDGSLIDYSSWASGEPSFIVPHKWTAETIREDCTVMPKDGQWNDVSCQRNATTTVAACICMQRCKFDVDSL